jgi:Zn finger protein HypA/HybF involved in hydrogenase expression
MVIENQAKELNGVEIECAHKIEIYCPECHRDVDETELAAQKCSDCGTALHEPEQHIAIAVTSVPAFGVTFEM